MRGRAARATRPRMRRGVGRATMQDVARIADVSPSTVSRVLRAPRSVSEQLVARVRSAIDRLGYVPNLMAGGLAAARGHTVGVVVPSIINSFFAGTVDTLSASLSSAGWQVIDGITNYSEAREEALIEAFLSWSPAAMIVTGVRHTPRAERLLRNARIPIVETWELVDNPIDVAVGFSHRDVGRTMTRHLVAGGRRRLAFVGAMMQLDHRAAQRADGFRDSAAEASGVSSTVIELPDRSSVAGGVHALAELLAAAPRPEAIYFSNDVLALGALFECQRRGLRVPEDIAIAGFGDLDFAAHCVPSLTTTRPPREAIGRETAMILLGRFAGQEPARRVVDLGAELIVRRSA